jgi:hypothetical protein
MSEDRILVAKAKVQRLLDANVIREVKYSEWLANVVLVPKKNGKNENVHRLHKSEQSMQERLISATKDR